MDVANAPNPSLAPLFDSCPQCCQVSDIAVCQGSSSSRNVCSFVLAGKKRIHNQSAHLPSPLNLPIHAHAPRKIFTRADSGKSLQSKRKGFTFATAKEKHFKFDMKSSKCFVEHDVFHAWDEKSVDLEKGISQNYDLFLERKSQEVFGGFCAEQLVANCRYSSRTVRFDAESANDRRIRKKALNPQKKMDWWRACASSAFAASCAAFGIHRLQSAFVNNLAGDSADVGCGGDGGGGNGGGGGGGGQGGGGEGMGESGSNVGFMTGKDEHEVRSTERFEDLENVKEHRGSKTLALASLSSATGYILNTELAAGGEVVTDMASEKRIGQTGVGTYEQILRLASEAPEKSAIRPEGVEHSNTRKVEEFSHRNSTSNLCTEENVQWFEGKAHVHITGINVVGSGSQGNEDNSFRGSSSALLPQNDSRPSVVPGGLLNNRELPAESNLSSFEKTKSGSQLKVETNVSRSMCNHILASTSVQDSGHQSDMKGLAVNSVNKPEEPELSVVVDHPTSFATQAERSHELNQKENFLDRIAGFMHSTVVKNIGGQRNSHRNAQEINEHEQKPLVKEAVASVLQQLFERTGDEALARKYEIGALRRLQRETFSDLLKIRERLDKLEHHVGLRQIKSLGDPLGVARTRLKGVVNVGSAFVFLEDKSSRVSRSALGQAGMQTGVDVFFTFETPFREKDMLIMKCGAGQLNDGTEGENLGGPVRIRKVVYSAQVTDELTVSLIPLGAEATDISDVVNPLQDRALTRFASGGPPLFGQCKGSAIGATIGNSSALVSMSQFLSGWGLSSFYGEPLCSSTLATCIYQPSDSMICSLSAVNNFYPSPPLPSSSQLHWSEMGPLVLSKSRTVPSNTSAGTSVRASNTSFFSQGSSFGGQCNSRSFESRLPQPKGTFGQAVSVAGEVDIGCINIGGWLQVDKGGMFQKSVTKQLQWAITLAKSAGSSVDWGLSLGTSKPYMWNTHTIAERNYLDPAEDIMEISVPQTQFEAFVKFNCGKACTLQPGILYVLNKHSRTPALIFRAQWCL